MIKQLTFKTRLYFTGIVTIAIWSLLIWNHFHGGVPSHHILAREDLPEISNWWGGLLIPVLSWFLLYRIHKRISGNPNEATLMANVLYRFLGALAFGILLSVFFTLRISDIPGYMLQSVFILALFLPLYRSECILGFVIGMTYTFGAVLPTGIGCILASISAALYLLVRPALIFIATRFKNLVSAKSS